MRRFAVLSALVTVGSLSLAAAYQQDAAQAPKVLEAEKLKDNLYVLKGANSGGNSAVFVTSTGVVIVDTKNPGWGQPILDKVRELTDKPITTVINTHTHFDHVSGNVEFPTTVEFIVQENTKANMARMQMPSGFAPGAPGPTIFESNGGKGMPTRTFSKTLTIGKGADRVDLLYFGRGHTNGDAWVLFPAARVLHAGDIFSGKNIPILDGNNGGSGVEIPKTLADAAKYADRKVDTIITGHSTQMTVADLREYAAFNGDFLAAVREAKKAGKTVDDVAGSWTIPAKYAGYAKPDPTRLKNNVDVTFKELK